MLVEVVVEGRTYRLRASQVVLRTEHGHPVAVAYEHDGTLIHSDAADVDFAKVLADTVGETPALIEKLK